MPKRCILCLATISGLAAPEHILLKALGGRFTTKTIICSGCNHEMGIGPDHDLVQSVAFLRTIAGLKSGDGGAADIIHNTYEDGVQYNLLPGGQPRLCSKNSLNVSNDETGFRVSINAYSEAEADKLLKGAARQIAKMCGHDKNPVVIETIENDIAKDKKINLIHAPPFHGQLLLGEGRSQQSMAKSAFTLWAKLVGNSECISSEYDPIRTYIKSNEPPELNEKHTKLDSRALPALPTEFGTNPNLIWAGSDAEGQVTGYFRLYNIVGWQFKLGSTSKLKNRQICLVSNPFKNKNREIFQDISIPIERDFFQTKIEPYPSQFESMTTGMDAFSKHASKASIDHSIADMITKSIHKSGLQEGDIIQEEHIDVLSEYISEHLAFMMIRNRDTPQER